MFLVQWCLLFIRDGPNTLDTNGEYDRVLALKESVVLGGETVMESTK